MENIFIESSSHTPEVDFNINGNLKIIGRSYPENASKFFDPIIAFVTSLASEKVTLNLHLEYFNTATSKKLMDLLRSLDANNKIKAIDINWHYEEGDDDSVESAEIYEESLLRTRFRYIVHEEMEEIS